MPKFPRRLLLTCIALGAICASVPVEAAKAHRASPTAAHAARKHVAAVVVVPAAPSFAQQEGLHAVHDPVGLTSGVALVVDQSTNEVLLSKNASAVLPIASITKLMSAMVVTESGQSMSELLTVPPEAVDTAKNTRSRLAVGTRLTREEMLHVALMSSENRAAYTLGANYPGGIPAFVAAMNRKAQQLGMKETKYVEPTGLSSNNQSSARDLATLVEAAYDRPILREFTTTVTAHLAIGGRETEFRSTNELIRNRKLGWDIALQKTGYITEAGHCMVMATEVAGRNVVMVFLDAAGNSSRTRDAERIRRWLTSGGHLRDYS